MSLRRSLMVDVGRHVRSVRTFLCLTQVELARASGVSQCAISRLENATGVATPHVVIVQVQRALAEGLRSLQERLPFSPEVLEMLQHPSMFAEASTNDRPLVADPILHEYLAQYVSVEPSLRPHLLSMVRASVEALVGSRTLRRGVAGPDDPPSSGASR